jgi:hypothetical protein
MLYIPVSVQLSTHNRNKREGRTMEIRKERNEMWGRDEYVLAWVGGEMRVRQTPDDRVMEFATLSKLQKTLGLSNAWTVKKACEQEPLMAEAKKLIEELTGKELTR